MTAQMSIVARRRGGTSLAGTLATLVQDIDPRLVLASAQSLADAMALGLTPQRMLATICGVMGLVALLLASMGIYGVTAYTVALDVGSSPFVSRSGRHAPRVIRMVFRHGTWLVAIGLAIGLALAIVAGQVLSVFFYGLPAAHVPTLLGTVALFLVIGVVASLVPAGRPLARDGGARFRRTERLALAVRRDVEVRTPCAPVSRSPSSISRVRVSLNASGCARQRSPYEFAVFHARSRERRPRLAKSGSI